MTLNQLLYFQAVAKYEHFRLAAASLNISQPSLSRSIANLEEELGIILFERKGRTVKLTKYGRLFLEHANRILTDVQLAEKQMKKLSGSSGHVDIAMFSHLQRSIFLILFGNFSPKSANEKISFNFHQTYTGEMVSGVAESERYDVIFGSYVENEPGIQFVPILKQEMIIITPLGHPLTKKKDPGLKDLENYPVMGYDRTSGLGQFTNRTYASYALSPTVICESPDENAIASLVAENFGIALVADVDSLDHFPLEKIHLTDVSLSTPYIWDT